MATVEISRLTKTFGNLTVVHDTSLVIQEGELLVLVGPSGCGKTTTLRMIAGLEDPDSGEIRIGDRIVNGVAPRDRDVAMVFQNYALYPHMTVRKNLGFGLKMRKVPRKEVTQRVEQVAEMLEIQSLLDRKPNQLSGGQQQRVALGRAIVRQPAVFLLDEPLSNLDAKLRATMRTELVKLQRQIGTTMIYVTHDQTEAMMMGDRIVVMHQGTIQQIGKPLQVYRKPETRFVAEFVGSPPMNFIEGQISNNRLQIGETYWDLRSTMHAEVTQESSIKVSMGLRPEDLSIADGESPHDAFRIDADVELVQSMGAETLIQCRWQENAITASVRTDQSLNAGDPIHLTCSPDRLHFFDTKTGQRL